MPSTLASPAHSELLIRKSRFLGCVQAMPDRAAAQQAVHRLWQQHPQATHICWALLAGGQSAAVDDGEPGGTAGRPMLEVLRHQDLDGVLATVVRYYGGIKLGAGGLVRAYTDAVAQALLGAEKVPIVARCALACRVPYAMEGLLRRALAHGGAESVVVEHADDVRFRFVMRAPDAAALVAQLNETGQGRVVWDQQPGEGAARPG
ncbi:MAG: YigZ family protein [Pseudomonadota bacterium]|nr:YigZ family protein [Pseudomonadota bacterium]